MADGSMAPSSSCLAPKPPGDACSNAALACGQNMALFHETHPPVGITHCSSSYFTHVPRQARGSAKSLPDLVLVRSNLLQICKVRVPHDDESNLPGSRLDEIASIRLAGLVESMAVLRGRSSSQKDALLLTFRDAKLSVLDWDEKTHSIHTSSLHYFEGDPSLRMGRTVFPMGPKVVTDPQGRCAAVLMFHTQLALLPAMETEGLELDLMMDEPEGEGMGGSGGTPAELVSATVGNSYVVNLAKSGIKQVRDMVFLHKYNEPVLLVLHEVKPTWVGRLRDAKDTMALAALSINVVHKRHPRIWEAQALPSDTFKLIAVPSGGALALSQNMIIYYTQGGSAGLVVNSHALPGKVPEKLEIDIEGEVLPAELAANHATRYCDNIHPEAAPAAAASANHAAASLNLDLSAARHVWLSKNSLALLLKSGQLVLTHLIMEAGNVKQMKVEPSLHAGVASCACQLGSNLIFLGSCLANSLLVHVTDHQEQRKRGRAEDAAGNESNPSKRVRLEGADPSGLGNQGIEDGAEEEEQKHSKQPPAKDRTFSFKVADTLLGIGAMRDMSIGDARSSAAAEWGQDSRRGPPQLVACSGQGKHGALSILRRNLVPELILEVPLPGVKGIWAVHHADAQTDTGMQLDVQGGPHHTYLLMSHPDSSETKVLETGDELSEVKGETGFMMAAPTIAAGNVLNHTLIIQVFPTGVRVLAGLEEVQDLPIQDILPSMEWRPQVVIAAAHIADPYVLLHFSDGSAVLLSGDEEEGCLVGQDDANQALQADINANPTTRLAAVALYQDSSGWLSRALSAQHGESTQPAQGALEGEQAPNSPGDAEATALSHDGLTEVEDAGLEGGQEGAPGGVPNKQEDDGNSAQQVKEEEQDQAAAEDRQASIAIFGEDIAGPSAQPTVTNPASHDHADESNQQATQSKAVDSADDVKAEPMDQDASEADASDLPDQPSSTALAAGASQNPDSDFPSTSQQQPPVQMFIVLCREQGDLQIFTLPGMELLFSFSNPAEGPPVLTSGGSSPRPHSQEGKEEEGLHVVEACMASFGPTSVSGVPSCERPVLLLLLSDGSLLTYQAFQPPHQPLAFRRILLDWTPHLTPNPQSTPPHPSAVQPSTRMQMFGNLGEEVAWSGIFILGANPVWLLACRGTLLPHPMEVEGPVAGFTPVHNVNCPQGFITAVGEDHSGVLKICQMPIKVHLDTPWPLQRVPQHATPHRICYYPEASLYMVLVSKDGGHKQWLEAEEGGDMHAAYSYALAKQAAKIKSHEMGYEVRLVQPGLWKTMFSYALGPAEDALCVKAMQLKNVSGESTPLIAVGTSQSFGEDYPATGRVLLFEIMQKATPSSSSAPQAEEEWDTNMIYSREFRGPVTNLTSLEGYIVLTIGNRLETHQWTGTSLQRTAFFDASILIASLNVVKSFVLFGDVHKGIYFVQYRDQGKQLNLLSKDFDNSDISATEFVINGSQLLFLAADEGLNVRLFKYNNKDALSWKGQKLLPVGCLHTGHRITRFLPQRITSTDTTPRHAAVYITQAGSMGYVTPLLNDSSEPLLQKLQRQIVLAQPQPAGLNPAAFRRRFQRQAKGLAGGQHFGKPLPAEGILDGPSVFDYQHLPWSKQTAVADACNSNRRAIMTTLAQLAAANSFF